MERKSAWNLALTTEPHCSNVLCGYRLQPVYYFSLNPPFQPNALEASVTCVPHSSSDDQKENPTQRLSKHPETQAYVRTYAGRQNCGCYSTPLATCRGYNTQGWATRIDVRVAYPKGEVSRVLPRDDFAADFSIQKISWRACNDLLEIKNPKEDFFLWACNEW